MDDCQGARSTASVCDTCQPLLESLLSRPEKGRHIARHQPSYAALQQSQVNGCLICRSAVAGSERIHTTNMVLEHVELGSVTERHVWLRANSTDQQELSNDRKIKKGGRMFRFFRLQDWPDTAGHVEAICEDALTAHTAADGRVMRLVQYWQDQCLKHHERCEKNVRPGWYPRRLLRLSDNMISLIDTALERPNRPYATASHCWGGARFVTLTEENISTFKTGVEVSHLPPNFQHLIHVARQLGIAYIWIDCYCIVQSSLSGNQADKAIELREMDQVYANAMLNIGATSALSPFDSCLVQRKPVPYEYASVTWQQGETGVRHRALLSSSVAGQELYDNPIFSRGWILQERLLCARMLHLAGTQLFWECKEVAPASEGLPYGNEIKRGIELRETFPFSIDPAGYPTGVNSVYSSRELLHASWCMVVNNYSKMHLSHPEEDKLLALGGIAKRVGSSLNAKYTAGLFHTDLLYQLCWTAFQPPYNAPGKPRRAAVWRAPSWSWASVDGIVSLIPAPVTTSSMRKHVALLDCHVELLDPSDEYGRLKTASLTLNGRLFDTKCRGGTFTLRNGLEIQPCFDDPRDAEPSEAFIVILHSEVDASDLLLDGLVLTRAREVGTYQRIGAFVSAFVPIRLFEEAVACAAEEQTFVLI